MAIAFDIDMWEPDPLVGHTRKDGSVVCTGYKHSPSGRETTLHTTTPGTTILADRYAVRRKDGTARYASSNGTCEAHASPALWAQIMEMHNPAHPDPGPPLDLLARTHTC